MLVSYDGKGGRAFQAEFCKNMICKYEQLTLLQLRQKGTICCQLIVPIILVSLVGVTQVLLNHFVVDRFHAGSRVYTSTLDTNDIFE